MQPEIINPKIPICHEGFFGYDLAATAPSGIKSNYVGGRLYEFIIEPSPKCESLGI